MPGASAPRVRAAAPLVLGVLIVLSVPSARAADVLAVMRGWGQFETFCRLVDGAGLAGRLRAPGPITVFAPTDTAFARLDAGELAALEASGNRARLRELLLYHVVPGRLRVFELRRETPRVTVQGKTVTSLLMSGSMMVNDAFIDIEDLDAGNGVVHGIDKVLRPPPRAPADGASPIRLEKRSGGGS